MTLEEVLQMTGDDTKPYGSGFGVIQVFNNSEYGPEYYHLSDYVVTSHASGPSLILVPRD